MDYVLLDNTPFDYVNTDIRKTNRNPEKSCIPNLLVA